MRKLELSLPSNLVDRFRKHSRIAERTGNDIGRDALSLYLQIANLVEKKNGPIVIKVDPSLSCFTVHHNANL